MDSCFILWVKTWCFLVFLLHLVLFWLWGALCWAPVFLWHYVLCWHKCVLVCAQHLLTFWYYEMLQAHLVDFLSQSWNRPLLQGALVPLFWGMVSETSIWEWGVLIGTEASFLWGHLAWLSKELYVWTLTYIYVCVYMYVCIYCIYMYVYTIYILYVCICM